MQKPKRRSYVIDLNGPAARGNLKILALLYPVWGLLLPTYILMLGQPNNVVLGNNFAKYGEQQILILLYFGLLYFTLSILTNRMVITGKTMRFWHRPFKSYKTAELKSLSLDQSPISEKRSLIAFKFNDDVKNEVIETAGMEDRIKSRLMAAVDNLAGQCQTPREVRTLLAQSSRVDAIQKTRDFVTVPYHSQLLMAQIKDRIDTYQQYFWRVWWAFHALITVIVAPIFTALAFEELYQQLFHEMYATSDISALLQSWAELWHFLYPVADQTVRGANALYSYSASQYASPAICTFAGACLLLLVSYCARPNRLLIGSNGLTLKLEHWGITISEQSIAWPMVAGISMSRHGSSNPDNWRILFKKNTGEGIMQLALGAIRGNAQKLELVKAIEKYASMVPVDADVLSALTPASESSYTELWLSSLASAPQREKLTPLSAGHALKGGAYVIDDRHGAGGQGVTYLARHGGAGDEPDLVIKETILPIYVDSQNRREAVEHFERDARLLLKLEHPNLVVLRDYFIEDHRAYLVLDRIHGNNLRQVVEVSGRLMPAQVLALARQMCQILAFLHSREPEIIHRDFTPENLMLDPDGNLKLIDFGVASELKTRTTATVVGKHAYLPPEQFRGKPTIQSDIYAMGATLYFLLTGKDPQPLSRLNPLRESQEEQDNAEYELHQALFSADQLNEEEAKAIEILAAVIEHATELDLARRTASAGDLLGELNEVDKPEAGGTIKIKIDERVKELS